MGAEATLNEFKKSIIRKRYLRCKLVCLIFHTIISHNTQLEERNGKLFGKDVIDFE